MQRFYRHCLQLIARLAFAGVALAIFCEPSIAQSRPTWAQTVEQWGVEEVTLTSQKAYANPFKDVTLQGVFRCSQQAVTVDGFYDGDGTWKLRFMPERIGSCTFSTTSNNKSLNDASGQFAVVRPGPKNHGPVRVAKTYHFSFADGTPYFLLGTTSYNWLNRDASLQEQTLATLRTSPFTKIRFGLFPKWYEFNRVDPPVFPYVRKADGSFDFGRFEPRFFANVEQRIRDLEGIGIQADIILFHPYDKWGFAKMDEAHNVAWLRYVTARLAAFRNVWWTMANEYDLMVPRDWDRLGQTVRISDPYGHPIGIHNAGMWYDPRKAWIDHVIIQDDPTAGRSAAIAHKRYQKPVVVDEYGYEGNNNQFWGELSGREEVERHWDITMAGGYASHGETYVHPDGVLWWAAGGTLVGESPARLGFLKQVMTSLPFQDMVPAPELVVNGTALAKPGQAYLFRFAWNPVTLIGRPSQVRLAGADVFKVELIDPWQMKIYLLGYTGAGDQAFTMPVSPALLRVTAASRSEQPHPIGELAATFSGNLYAPAAPNPALFKPEVLHYSIDFQIGQLELDPRAKAVLQKFLPKAVFAIPVAAAIPANILPMVMHIDPGTMQAIDAELKKIPVE
jgi:hypothetical protein